MIFKALGLLFNVSIGILLLLLISRHLSQGNTAWAVVDFVLGAGNLASFCVNSYLYYKLWKVNKTPVDLSTNQ